MNRRGAAALGLRSTGTASKRPEPYRLARISFGCDFGDTFGCACAIFPRESMTYVMRFANSAPGESAAP